MPAVSRFALLFCSGVLIVSLAACSSRTTAQPEPPNLQAQSKAYTLGPGDKVKITVFGEEQLSGEFEVDSTGKISMPLAGDVPAVGQTINQVSSTIVQRLTTGYLRDPKVSVEVLTYRPFFILGEVMRPGSFPYASGMTVVNAVALAGGYTYRADKTDITVKRAADPNKNKYHIEETGFVGPGDVVEVPERFF